MITAISTDKKLRCINNMLSEISDIYQKLLLSKNIQESVFIVMSSILELGEGCLQKDIAEKSYTNKKTINSTIKKLQKDEYIELKAGKYPNMHIYLTDKGREFMKSSILPIIELEKNVLECISEREFETLVSSHTSYIRNFREHVEEFVIRNS